MTEPQINPWSSTPSLDIEKTFAEFGIDPIAPVLPELPEIPYFMRRGIVLGQRDYLPIARAIRNHTPFYLLTGFMPSGHPHLGHLLLMKEIVWHVQQGATGYVTIADREAYGVRGLSWEKCREYGKEYLSCLYALGYEGETYFQSKNNRLKDLAFEAATKVNFSELSAIYGFGPETALAHADSVITQVADILYPQVEKGPAPTIVPVGIDQDPHIRLTRGIANKFRMFLVEEREGLISVRSKNAPDGALEAGEKGVPAHEEIRGSRGHQGRCLCRCERESPRDRTLLWRVRFLHALLDLPPVPPGSHRGKDVVKRAGEFHLVFRARGSGEKEGDECAHRRQDDAR